MKIKGVIPLITAFLLLFASCTARINGSIMEDGQANFHIYAALEPRITALIGLFSPGTPILDGPAVAATMSTTPGISSVSFINVSPSAIEGPVKVSKIDDLLTASGKTSEFIHIEQLRSGGRCTIIIDLDSGPDILDLISPEINDYLSALMAPLATGEILTKTEYLTLVGSVYGRAIADEIARASITASIEFPGQIQSVRGGTFSQRKAEFNIPLLDILVLETPISYEVVWR